METWTAIVAVLTGDSKSVLSMLMLFQRACKFSPVDHEVANFNTNDSPNSRYRLAKRLDTRYNFRALSQLGSQAMRGSKGRTMMALQEYRTLSHTLQ